MYPRPLEPFIYNKKNLFCIYIYIYIATFDLFYTLDKKKGDASSLYVLYTNVGTFK